ncbi:hypothetical protein DERP_000172 [Dermatophagoides pteronyssinus]|uniref:Uncharacterized protein n=1 Tax=Dermatophagoides pteronyssinus TaxID=6956 RepID=A0ABQ8IZI0_DERPT|nr:hypothetical protein DERP_000172 [Dermatophagoides pteronyssinus]
MSGPPSMQSGAITAPTTPQCNAHASCLLPNPSRYGIDCATIDVPIIAPIVNKIPIMEFFVTRFITNGLRKAAIAEPAVMANPDPK